MSEEKKLLFIKDLIGVFYKNKMKFKIYPVGHTTFFHFAFDDEVVWGSLSIESQTHKKLLIDTHNRKSHPPPLEEFKIPMIENGGKAQDIPADHQACGKCSQNAQEIAPEKSSCESCSGACGGDKPKQDKVEEECYLCGQFGCAGDCVAF